MIGVPLDRDLLGADTIRWAVSNFACRRFVIQLYELRKVYLRSKRVFDGAYHTRGKLAWDGAW